MYFEEAKKKMEEISKMKEFLNSMGMEGGELSLDKPRPCTEEEVKALEEKLGRPLPSSYREFLLWMGKGVGNGDAMRFMCSEDFFIWNWEQEQEMLELAREVLQDDQFPGELPEDAFVFFFHLSYIFCFFRLSEGDDPPVYLWEETCTEFKKTHEHFSDWLLKEIEIHGEGVELYAPSSTEVKGDVSGESEETT